MNKKILISLSVIGVVAAIAIGGTIAFFSDTETSTGNTFTAGSIDLKIDNHAWFNGVLQDGSGETQDFTWELDDLTEQVFFNYTDLKPGDWEEDTLSIHVYDNPSWVCADIDLTLDADISCTEPEWEDDEFCGAGDPLWNGELGSEMQFIFWADDGDNVYEDNEYVVYSGNMRNDLYDVTLPIVDSNYNIFSGQSHDPLPGQTTVYIGKAFCFGSLNAYGDDPGVGNPAVDPGFNCDGYLVNNASQSDSVVGSVSFTAVQSRNNDNFSCYQP